MTIGITGTAGTTLLDLPDDVLGLIFEKNKNERNTHRLVCKTFNSVIYEASHLEGLKIFNDLKSGKITNENFLVDRAISKFPNDFAKRVEYFVTQIQIFYPNKSKRAIVNALQQGNLVLACQNVNKQIATNLCLIYNQTNPAISVVVDLINLENNIETAHSIYSDLVQGTFNGVLDVTDMRKGYMQDLAFIFPTLQTLALKNANEVEKEIKQFTQLQNLDLTLSPGVKTLPKEFGEITSIQSIVTNMLQITELPLKVLFSSNQNIYNDPVIKKLREDFLFPITLTAFIVSFIITLTAETLFFSLLAEEIFLLSAIFFVIFVVFFVVTLVIAHYFS